MSDVLIPNWTLADRLEKAREVAGVERATIAAELGVTERTISNYETGHTTPKLIVLKVYNELTGVPLWWLLDEREPTDRAVHAGYPGQLSFTESLFRYAA